VDWSGLGGAGTDLTQLIGLLAELRRGFPQLREGRWLEGRRPDGSYDILWLTPDATEMTLADWEFPGAQFLSYLLGPSEVGGAPLYIVLNAASEPVAFKLPAPPKSTSWTLLLDTASKSQDRREFPSGTALQALARSVLVFAGKVP